MESTQHIFDDETSASLARRVRAQFRRCWRNAAMAVSHLGHGAHYVEGWIVTDSEEPVVVEHGWCETEQRIVDPSYTPYVSTYPPPVAYFAGVRFGIREAEAGLSRGRLPLVWSRDEREHWKAFERAWGDAMERRFNGTPYPDTRVVNCRREPCDLFIGRPSKWANPFHIGRDGTREQVINKYRSWLIRQPRLLRDVWMLRGLILGCDCLPLPCHGNVLAALADFGAAERVKAAELIAAPADPIVAHHPLPTRS